MLKPVDNNTGSMPYSLSNKTLYYTGPWLPCMLKPVDNDIVCHIAYLTRHYNILVLGYLVC
jgi:hypothetical protein